MGKELDKSDIKLFGREHDKIIQYVLTSGRWLNPVEAEEKVLSLFSGAEREELERIYARSHEIWPQEGEGLLAEIRYNDDVDGLESLVKELHDMNNTFLGMASARFAQIMAEP
jgi:hypothetical protein